MKQSEIKFTVTLDDSRNPEKISWKADDSGVEGEKECKALMLSVWDKKDSCTLRIDLWTKEMMVEEMQHLIYETIRSLGETYTRATNDKSAGDELLQFAARFGKLTNVLK
ncbi:MAG TPA: gliding motility protein GldC [Bacteroidia bacterium]|nr:gliding motility protein GldC [Bacteroidia bacterium]